MSGSSYSAVRRPASPFPGLSLCLSGCCRANQAASLDEPCPRTPLSSGALVPGSARFDGGTRHHLTTCTKPASTASGGEHHASSDHEAGVLLIHQATEVQPAHCPHRTRRAKPERQTPRHHISIFSMEHSAPSSTEPHYGGYTRFELELEVSPCWIYSVSRSDPCATFPILSMQKDPTTVYCSICTSACLVGEVSARHILNRALSSSNAYPTLCT